ncbi:hypothetical protein PPL_07010 [Heterostelium album PN500]|uniref:Uncharacterized protein n=1 Tax=Heterostelium pallidum (strain ATCC 26659 / Pp 5 / PN500) TaxID=670386 RepID=D3BE57_HETP5|nr:hypothetical protein PPL_07010 [Heterostelium album PN500]EFA80188.1 hypothetical protein PPL_07010 [Heterostelium album PN500]|eukprot:XP_020432308.1 hypothetical protein PPL_07010 [Heterostelium album PN500]
MKCRVELCNLNTVGCFKIVKQISTLGCIATIRYATQRSTAAKTNQVG